MNSFYGGRPGNSFVIITTFRSVADMVTNFKLGSQYVAVHYDEYVMINTPNKNDPDNGKIYRRGYDFTNELGGAQYIGTIVGPAGKAPMLEIVSRQEVHNKSAEQGFQERKSSGSASVEAGSLVPGKESDDVYNDEISWECCSIRTSNNEDTTAYIGFTLPYPVIELETEQVQPYYLDIPQDTSYATRTDDRTHPFYSKWKLGIPRGVKGNSSKNLRTIVASQGIVNEDYQGKSDDELNNRQILVCDEYNYDDGPTGDPQTKYIGPYNMISGIALDDDGTLTVNYTHDDPSVYNKKIKWVKSVSIDPDTGEFVTHFNHEYDDQGHQTLIRKNLNWVKGIDIDNYGVVTLRYLDSTTDRVLDTKVKWVKNILVSQKGKVTVQWNTIGENSSFDTTEIQTPLKWIDNISTEDNGTINVKYNTDDVATSIPNALTYINNTELRNDGHFVFKFNNQSKQDIVVDQPLKWIESTDLGDDGSVTFNYNDGTTETSNTKLKWLRGIDLTSKGAVNLIWNLPNSSGGYQSSKIELNIPNEGKRTFIYRGLRGLQVAQLDGVDHLYALYSIKNGTGRTLNYTFYDETQNNELVTRAVDGWEDLGPITNFPNLPTIRTSNDTQEFGQQVLLGTIESEGNNWVLDFTMPCSQFLGDSVTGMQPVTSGSGSASLRISSDDSRVTSTRLENWHEAGSRVANGFHFRFIFESGKGSLTSPILVTIQCSSFTGQYISS